MTNARLAVGNSANPYVTEAMIKPELRLRLKMYRLIRDCLDGAESVKYADTIYLPKPDPTNTSDANTRRYQDYKNRAVFYNVTSRTVDGLTGQVFARDANSKIPVKLRPLIQDIDGKGVSLKQLAKKAVSETLAFGRCGLWVDYPDNQGVMPTMDMEKKGETLPTVELIVASNIINWKMSTNRGKKRIEYICLAKNISNTYYNTHNNKQFSYETNKTGEDKELMYTELYLDSKGLYVIKEYYNLKNYHEGIPKDKKSVETYYPKNNKGQRLDFIPFVFIGSENNDETIDRPPMYDLAEINIGHYRNSADYEESCFIIGQPTPYFSGLTAQWADTILNQQIRLGSSAAVPLPIGADAGLIQANPNQLTFEAMKHKEEQMIALGARILQNSEVQKTATEVTIEYTSENSILSSIANNVSDAFEKALQYCYIFVSSSPISETLVKYRLNDDFNLAKLSADERRQVVSEWLNGAITFEELRMNLKRSGIILEETNDKEIMGEIKSKEEKSIRDVHREGEAMKANQTGRPTGGGQGKSNDGIKPKT